MIYTLGFYLGSQRPHVLAYIQTLIQGLHMLAACQARHVTSDVGGPARASVTVEGYITLSCALRLPDPLP